MKNIQDVVNSLKEGVTINIPDEVLKDYDFLKQVCEQIDYINSGDIIKIPKEYFRQEEFCKVVINKNPSIRKYVVNNVMFFKDKDFLKSLMKTDSFGVYYKLSQVIKNDRDFALELLNEKIDVVLYLDKSIMKDREIAEKSIKLGGYYHRFFKNDFPDWEFLQLSIENENKYALNELGSDILNDSIKFHQFIKLFYENIIKEDKIENFDIQVSNILKNKEYADIYKQLLLDKCEKDIPKNKSKLNKEIVYEMILMREAQILSKLIKPNKIQKVKKF
jgi:hypothetical protein